MADAAPVYRRLPGRSYGLFSAGALWDGGDHILVVSAAPGGEHYRRFFYRDIQAVVHRPTATRLWVNVMFGTMAVLNLVVFIAARDSGGWLFLTAAGLAIWFAGIVINSARGPTCDTRIQTAVQNESVPPLGRVPVVRQWLREVRPRLLAVQTESGPVPDQPLPPS